MKTPRYRVYKSKTSSVPVFSTNWKFLAQFYVSYFCKNYARIEKLVDGKYKLFRKSLTQRWSMTGALVYLELVGILHRHWLTVQNRQQRSEKIHERLVQPNILGGGPDQDVVNIAVCLPSVRLHVIVSQ
jgi:hypothetical protein